MSIFVSCALVSFASASSRSSFAYMPGGAIGLTDDPGTLEGYAVALHELGHFATARLGDDVLTQEQRAWDWAREQSLLALPEAFIQRVSRRTGDARRTRDARGAYRAERAAITESPMRVLVANRTSL